MHYIITFINYANHRILSQYPYIINPHRRSLAFPSSPFPLQKLINTLQYFQSARLPHKELNFSAFPQLTVFPSTNWKTLQHSKAAHFPCGTPQHSLAARLPQQELRNSPAFPSCPSSPAGTEELPPAPWRPKCDYIPSQSIWYGKCDRFCLTWRRQFFFCSLTWT